MPSALTAMSSASTPNKQGKTTGALISMSVLAMIIGPNIGGYITQLRNKLNYKFENGNLREVNICRIQ